MLHLVEGADNAIGDDGARVLGDVLLQNETLTELRVSSVCGVLPLLLLK